jgi:hypothetical protein
MKSFHDYLENIEDALSLMKTVGSKPSTLSKFTPGTKVIIQNRDFYGEEGEVVGTETNAFGKPLIAVKRPGSDRTVVFYPGELQIKSELN